MRTQLKSVFSKTDTNRQGELVSMVLNGPAVWLRLVKGQHSKRTSEPSGAEHILELDDDRVLSYGDYGPEQGKPVFVFHHLLGSITERPSDQDLLRRLNIRLIVPERPGIGRSTPIKNRRLVDCSDDIRQLADHLGIPEFHVLGFSTGGPHAAACAALLKDRVVKLALVASLMPIDELPEKIPTNLAQRFLTGMSRHWPSGIHSLLELRDRRLLENLDQATAEFEREGSPADAALLRDPVIRRNRMKDRMAAAEVPKSVFAAELVLLSQPWGFRVSDIRVPVRIWHGRQDDFFPIAHAEAMASLIPDCRAVFEDAWGHFFLYREWERILAELVN